MDAQLVSYDEDRARKVRLAASGMLLASIELDIMSLSLRLRGFDLPFGFFGVNRKLLVFQNEFLVQISHPIGFLVYSYRLEEQC